MKQKNENPLRTYDIAFDYTVIGDFTKYTS